jgi:hypothetical protein
MAFSQSAEQLIMLKLVIGVPDLIHPFQWAIFCTILLTIYQKIQWYLPMPGT